MKDWIKGWLMGKLLAIINCKSGKQKYVCSAKEMYSKSLFFRTQLSFLEAAYNKVLILSSKHGLISLNETIEPYELSFEHRKRVKKNRIVADDNYIRGWGKKVADDIKKNMKEYDEIHLHISNSYWNPIKDYLQNNPKITKVSQQINPGENKNRYIEALEHFKQNNKIDLGIITEKSKPLYPEVAKFFYGPNGEIFFGYTRGLIKKYPYLDEGTIHMLSKGKIKHHKGWVINKKLLESLHQLKGGQWRVKQINQIVSA